MKFGLMSRVGSRDQQYCRTIRKECLKYMLIAFILTKSLFLDLDMDS